MKKPFYHLKFFTIALVLALMASCSGDDDFTVLPPSFETDQKLQDTITVGNSLELYPKLNKTENTVYAWILDGETVSTDSIYNFKPKTRGDQKLTIIASNAGGNVSLTYNIHIWGAYENGFFTLNEGWFGHGTGTVGFYRYDSQKIEDSVYVKTNPGKNFEPMGSTLEFGSVYNEKLYLATKVDGPFVVADAYSLKELGRIPAEKGNNWRAFVGLDESHGLLSTSDGIYKLNLDNLQLEGKVPGISGQVGDMIREDNYIFILSQREGLQILNATSLEVVKTIPDLSIGFAKTNDDKIWSATSDKLVSIDPSSLEVQELDLNFEVSSSWGAWHPGSIAADDNNVFIANGSGDAIYKFTGDIASLSTPFITIPDNNRLYGSGVGYDEEKGQLVITTVDETYAKNTLFFYDPASGQQLKTAVFEGYYFPATTVFHD